VCVTAGIAGSDHLSENCFIGSEPTDQNSDVAKQEQAPALAAQ